MKFRCIAAAYAIVGCASVPVKMGQMPNSAHGIPPQVGLMVTKEGKCTATLIHEGMILTAAHCTDALPGVFVYDGGRRKAFVVAWVRKAKSDDERTNDVAVGVLSGPQELEPARIASPEESVGHPIFYGFGCHDNLSPRSASVDPSKFDYGAHAGAHLDICHGDSGGPLINDRGHIVAILSGAAIEDDGPHTILHMDIVWADPTILHGVLKNEK